MRTEDTAIDFYPTPDWLVSKMLARVKGSPKVILEPSAGKGVIVDALKKSQWFDRILAIEKDQEMQTLLFGKGVNVVDSDFMTYSGADKFDLIIANPPFSNGAQHLLRMIDIMYNGQIICLLNAETLKNPYTNERKDLVRKLEEMGAEIEYMSGAFADAERHAEVEVALVNIVIKRDIEDDLFAHSTDGVEKFDGEVHSKQEISRGESIYELVAEYNEVVDLCMKTIIDYYRRFKKVGKYVNLVVSGEEISRFHDSPDATMTRTHSVQ